MNIVTARDIRAALIQRGYSIRSWAIENDFEPRTVQKCIQEHNPSTEKVVRGQEYKAILRTLSALIDKDLLGVTNE